MRFSERTGLRPIKNVIQTDDMDQDLRIGLWNALTLLLLGRCKPTMGTAIPTVALNVVELFQAPRRRDARRLVENTQRPQKVLFRVQMVRSV